MDENNTNIDKDQIPKMWTTVEFIEKQTDPLLGIYLQISLIPMVVTKEAEGTFKNHKSGGNWR